MRRLAFIMAILLVGCQHNASPTDKSKSDEAPYIPFYFLEGEWQVQSSTGAASRGDVFAGLVGSTVTIGRDKLRFRDESGDNERDMKVTRVGDNVWAIELVPIMPKQWYRSGLLRAKLDDIRLKVCPPFVKCSDFSPTEMGEVVELHRSRREVGIFGGSSRGPQN